jgi:hypothetical protein
MGEGDRSSLPFDRFIEGWFSVQLSLSNDLENGLPNLQNLKFILQNTYRIKLLFPYGSEVELKPSAMLCVLGR